jgi:hypothetical protein
LNKLLGNKSERILTIDFFGNGLCSHCHSAQNELIEFNNFHVETEFTWSQKDSDLQNEISRILTNHPESDHSEIVENYSWDLHQNQYKFPNIHRESLVITIYNFLENQLNELCHILECCSESKVKLKDLSGLGIEKTLSYLTKVGGFSLSGMGRELPYIKGVNTLRNQIVHNGGNLPESDGHKLNKFILRTDTLSGNPGGQVLISPHFISEYIFILRDFFEKLDEEVQKFIQVSNA